LLFFSSRRRHTRFSRDWSSDVCSSDLEELRLVATEDRLEAELRNGDGPRLVVELEQLAAAHPLRERPTALLMQAQVAAGRPAEEIGRASCRDRVWVSVVAVCVG